jgi:hypothetical protein
MTLVIAKLDPQYNDFRIISDTKVTDEMKKEHSKRFEGVVKSVIYTPEICISYAGSIVSAEEILKSIFDTNFKLDFKALVKLLKTFHLHRNRDIEFLITNIQYNMLGFVKISDGKTDISYKSSWIGDIEAFELFQEKYHKYLTKEKNNSIYESTEKAFADVLESQKCQTVGGIQVEIERSPLGFRYLHRMYSSIGRSQKITFDSNMQHIVDFGSAKEGSYNFCRLISNNPKTPAFGNYYYDGNFGIFAYPEKTLYFKKYNNLSVDEFVENIYSEYQVKLIGAISERGIIRYIK